MTSEWRWAVRRHWNKCGQLKPFSEAFNEAAIAEVVPKQPDAACLSAPRETLHRWRSLTDTVCSGQQRQNHETNDF